jgi:hypothetical protein
MRALFAAAAVILSVTAVHAQEVKPAAVVPQDSTERAIPPAMPSSTLIEQLRAVGELKDAKPLEAPAPRIDATDARPAGAKPGEAKPVETKPVDVTSTDAKPVDVKPVEAATPAEIKPAETKAVAAKAVESRPAQAGEAKPAKKRVVRKRETDEQKARRIAAKYGISW